MPIDFTGLEKALHLEDGSLSKLNESQDSSTLDLSHLKVFKNEDYELLQTNTLKEHEEALMKKQDYSRTAATEENVKFFKKELGLDFQGKDVEGAIEAIKLKLATGGGEDGAKEILEYQEKLKAYKDVIEGDNGYKAQIASKDSSYKDLETSIQKDRDSIEINGLLDAEIGTYADSLKYSVEDFKILYQNKYNRNLVKTENGIETFDGEKLLKNELKEILDYKKDIKKIITEGGYLKTPEGGKAGESGGESGSKVTSQEFSDDWDARNPNGSSGQKSQDTFKAVMSGKIEDV